MGREQGTLADNWVDVDWRGGTAETCGHHITRREPRTSSVTGNEDNLEDPVVDANVPQIGNSSPTQQTIPDSTVIVITSEETVRKMGKRQKRDHLSITMSKQVRRGSPLRACLEFVTGGAARRFCKCVVHRVSAEPEVRRQISSGMTSQAVAAKPPWDVGSRCGRRRTGLRGGSLVVVVVDTCKWRCGCEQTVEIEDWEWMVVSMNW